jgi:hypothetical protein
MLENYEEAVACRMYKGNEKCLQNFGLKASREETSWEK